MTISALDSCADSGRRSTAVVRIGAFASYGRLERAHADHVVRGSGEEKLPVHAGPSPMAEFAEPADRLDPAKDFFDAFACALTDGVAGVPRRPSIQCPALLLEGDVRRGLEVPQGLHKAARV